MSDIVKQPDDTNKLRTADGQIKIGPKPGGLAARVAAAKQKAQIEQADALTVPNRICLMLDCSGSMNGEPIVLLRQAVEAYTNACNFRDTSIALEPFPLNYGGTYRQVPLTTNKWLLQTEGQKLSATGGTPIDSALKNAIENNSITRGVLVSDGSPDSEERAYAQLGPYIETQTPVDTVHIGISQSGEEFLKTVAERTGGIYMKFKDIGQFVGAFKYLSPALRGFLVSSDIKEITGADDVGEKRS